jgi:protein-L-isoaspartate(D-aspartate) O-methyltransferase
MESSRDFDDARRRMLDVHLYGRGIRDRRVLEAMRRVPRERFVPQDLAPLAYDDRALAIDCGQTISQPYIVALMTEALRLSGTEHVLEVGTGSGYQTAVLAELAGDVVSIERHEDLSRAAAATLRQLGYGNVELVVGDGTHGWPSRAPYDRVIVTAAAAACPPPLLAQLRHGGVLVAPLGADDSQVLQAIHKRGERTQAIPLTGCRFVPLVSDRASSGDGFNPRQ